MIISYHTVAANLDVTRGYGKAGFNVVRSLQELGHKVPFNNASAPVQISFCQPNHFVHHPGQFKIGYTPWESTELPPNWLKKFNECDEVWATSDWVYDIYREAGVTVPMNVYPHGVEKQWQPFERKTGDVVKFLHVGEPALRKGGQMAVDAFRAAFGDRTDVHLTIKAYHQHWVRAFDDMTRPYSPDKVYNNVTVITESIKEHELLQLHLDHDVLVYPSYGEGFGLIPLQALATGMPVICTGEWAQYSHFLGDLNLSGTWNRSIWALHPGNVLYPNYDELVSLYLYSFNNIDQIKKTFLDQAPEVIEEFDWKSLTEKSFKSVVERFTDN